jgi:hypothetical protein
VGIPEVCRRIKFIDRFHYPTTPEGLAAPALLKRVVLAQMILIGGELPQREIAVACKRLRNSSSQAARRGIRAESK